MRVVGGGGHRSVLGGGGGMKKRRGWLGVLKRMRVVGNVG